MNEKQVEKNRFAFVETKNSAVKIAVILFQSSKEYINENQERVNESRFSIMEKALELCGSEADLIVFPGGTYTYAKITEKGLKEIEAKIKMYLNKMDKDKIICFGVDSDDGSDQIGIACSKKGIIAMGRKFHPAPNEEGFLKKARSAYEKELGYHRTFEFQGKKCFLAVCYDGFGIRHKKLRNNGVGIIIELIHAFNPKGERGAGEVYFAKHGLAGASKEWGCPSVGAAVFFDRPIPSNWQSGVLWNQGSISTKEWKYEDNPLKVQNTIRKDFECEKIEIRTYAI